MLRSRRWAWLILGLLVAAGFAGLGRWQLGRAEFKHARQAQAQAVLAQRQARPLAELSRSAESALTWVAGRGHYLPRPTLLLDNQRRGDRVGVRVYRLFLPEGGKTLLVDLGWLPLPGDRRLPRLPPPVSGAQYVQGLSVPPPSAGLALGPTHAVVDADTWLLTRIDLPALSSTLASPLADKVLRLDPALPGGFDRDLNLMANTLSPDKHRGYALQWFGLSAASLLVTLILLLRKTHHD